VECALPELALCFDNIARAARLLQRHLAICAANIARNGAASREMIAGEYLSTHP
jgi:hypothetical protein